MAVSEVVQASHPEPNVGGVPLWMISSLSDDEQQAVILLWERSRRSTHLAGYVQHCLDVTPARHHEVICQAIDDLLADEYDDLLVCTPPGAAKSTYTSHGLGAYFMGRSPRSNIILATHTADLSEKWSRKVRNTIMDSRHQHLFPYSSLSRDSTAVGRWATSLGGEFLAVGVGASILGFRADLAIIDDPVSGFEQAQSETQLAKVHNWFETDLLTRFKPGAKMVLICQRLAANDLAGYVILRHQENPTRRLRVVTLRMLAEPGEDDGTGRVPGDRLWPEWFTPEMVADAQRDAYRWQTLYQQRPPSSAGDWVDPADIHIVDTVPVGLPYYLCSDLALSVNKGDYSVHLAVGVGPGNQVYVVDAWRERAAVDKTVERHLDMVTTYKPLESLIDDDNASKVYVQLLASRARERGVPVPYKALPMRGQDKETRAAPLRGMLRSGRVSFKRASWNEWLVREMMLFPNAMGSGVDDGVDALGLIGRRLASLVNPSATTTVSTVRDSSSMCLDDLFEQNERHRHHRKRIA